MDWLRIRPKAYDACLVVGAERVADGMAILSLYKGRRAESQGILP